MKWLGIGLLLFFSWGCLMLRKYESVPVQNSKEGITFLGLGNVSTNAEAKKRVSDKEVLQRFGPPTEYLQTPEGILFIYLYKGRHLNEFFLGAPRNVAGGRFTLFDVYYDTYKQDKLMIFFDRTGLMSDYAYHEGTDELSTFF
ncbi:MAG: hypothetical protein AABZ60_09850 [Planctomycetota bacterium]